LTQSYAPPPRRPAISPSWGGAGCDPTGSSATRHDYGCVEYSPLSRGKFAAADGGLLVATATKVVEVTNLASEADAIGWWEGLTRAGTAPTTPGEENLHRLRSRALGAKRSLAIREFALGIEGLERFVRGEPLRRDHECVFGVLAMESEPVDPRL